MSRRRDKALENLKGRHLEGGGEEYYTDYMGLAEEAGVDWQDFMTGHYPDGSPRIDEDALMAAVEEVWSGATNGEHLMACVVVRCQRCNYRVDRLWLWRSRLIGNKPPWFASQAGVKITGSAPLSYACPCGRKDLRVSLNRLANLYQLALEIEKGRREKWQVGTDLHSREFPLCTFNEVLA